MTARRLTWGAVVLLIAAGIAWATRPSDAGITVTAGRVERTASMQSIVSASGEIVASRFADIGSSVMGRLVSVAVKEGDRVIAGQVVARIDPIQASAAADGAAAALAALAADAGAALTQVQSAEASLAEARARASEVGQALMRARQLREAGLLAAAEFDRADAADAVARAQVDAAVAAVARATQSKTATERRVTQGRAEQARVRDQLSKTEITAPIDGVVTRLDAEVGEMVVIGVQNQPGTILMTISDLAAVDAEINVAEADVMRLAIGMPARVSLEAVAGRQFPGRVIAIGASALPRAGAQAAAREFRVKVRLDGTDLSLRPGLTCDAEIVAAERRDVLTAPLAALVERDGRTGLFRLEGDRARFVPVTGGIIGGLDIAVDGIEAGTEIVAGPIQALRQLQDGARVRRD